MREVYRDEEALQIHCNQDKKNCYLDVGDIVRVTIEEEGEWRTYEGELQDIGLRIQNGTDCDGIHPCMLLKVSLPDGRDQSYLFWMNAVLELEVLAFYKEEVMCDG